MANLASSVFSRKPDELALVADIYKQSNAVTVNSYQDNLFTAQDQLKNLSFASPLKSKEGLLSSLKSAKDSAKGTIGGAVDDVKSKVSEINSTINGALGSSTGKIKTLINDSRGFIQEFNPVTGTNNLANNIGYTVNGIKHDIISNKIGPVRSTLDTLNALCGDVDYLMKADGVIANILSSLLNNASNLGILNAFQAAALCGLSSIGVDNKYKAINQMTLNVLPNYLNNADVQSVASISSFTNDGYANALNASSIKYLSKNETKYNDYDFTWYKTQYSKIDQNWNKSYFKTIGLNLVYDDISKLTEASDLVRDKFVKGALASSDHNDKMYAVLDKIRTEVDVDDEIRKLYPFGNMGKNKNYIGRDLHPGIW